MNYLHMLTLSAALLCTGGIFAAPGDPGDAPLGGEAPKTEKKVVKYRKHHGTECTCHRCEKRECCQSCGYCRCRCDNRGVCDTCHKKQCCCKRTCCR